MDKQNNHESRIARNEEDIQDLWKVVDEIKKMMIYRLPLWAVFLMSGLTGLCGWLLHFATVASKLK